MRNLLYIIVISFSFTSCTDLGFSLDKMTYRIKNEIDADLSLKASELGNSFKINRLSLLSKSKNEYIGILKTSEDSQEFTYIVAVTVNGDKLHWRTLECY